MSSYRFIVSCGASAGPCASSPPACASARAATAPSRGWPRGSAPWSSRLRGSISSSGCPARTMSPSATCSETTLPIVSALMSTWRAGSILPLAETIASRSCRAIFSTVTLVAGVRRQPRLSVRQSAEHRQDAQADENLLGSSHELSERNQREGTSTRARRQPTPMASRARAR